MLSYPVGRSGGDRIRLYVRGLADAVGAAAARSMPTGSSPSSASYCDALLNRPDGNGHPTVSARRSSHSISRHSRRGVVGASRTVLRPAVGRIAGQCAVWRSGLSCLAIEPGAGRLGWKFRTRHGYGGRRAELRAPGRARLAPGRMQISGRVARIGPGPGRICVGRACRRAGHSGASAGRSKRRHSSQGKVRHNEITCDVSCRHRCNCAHRGRQSASLPTSPASAQSVLDEYCTPGSARNDKGRFPTGTNCPTPPPSCGRTAPIFNKFGLADRRGSGGQQLRQHAGPCAHSGAARQWRLRPGHSEQHRQSHAVRLRRDLPKLHVCVWRLIWRRARALLVLQRGAPRRGGRARHDGTRDIGQLASFPSVAFVPEKRGGLAGFDMIPHQAPDTGGKSRGNLPAA